MPDKKPKKAGKPEKPLIAEKPAATLSNSELDFFKDTSEIDVSKRLVDQVIGQDDSVEIIRKAAAQKRNVLLIGLPGTGKSMLAQAMSEILPVSKLEDILVYPNGMDPNNPKIRIVKAGVGKQIVQKLRLEAMAEEDQVRTFGFLLSLGWFLFAYFIWRFNWISDVIYAALLLLGAVVMIGFSLGNQMRPRQTKRTPKLLVDNFGKKIAPFAEATGARAGSLLGDVRHDPLQSSIDEDKIVVQLNGRLEEKSFEQVWQLFAVKYPALVENYENGYQAFVFPADEQVFTNGFKDGQVVRSRIYSMNRRPFEGKVVEIKTSENKISLTPEHKVILRFKDKAAESISKSDSLITLDVQKQLAIER